MAKELRVLMYRSLITAAFCLNFALTALVLSRAGNVAAAHAVPAVLRAHALQIVDERGRTRASIKIYPAKGGYPETVLLRLITSNGRPNVKIAANEDGSGMVLGGQRDPAYAQVLSRGTTPQLVLRGLSGKEKVVRP